MIDTDSWKGDVAEVKLLQQCKEAIREVVANSEVILYGSRARHTAEEISDYDILILVDGPVDMALKERLVSNVYPLELDSGAVLTLLAYSKQQWDSALYRAMTLHKNIDREGVVL